MRIRLGKEEDLDTIMTIVKAVTEIMNGEGNFQWNQCYPLREDFVKDIENQELFVATSDEEEEHASQLLGMIAISSEQPDEYNQISTWDHRRKALVPHRLAVSPFHQSRGVAQQLLLHVERLAADRGVPCIRVDTNDQNVRVHHILEKKLGYEFKGMMQFKDFHPEIYEHLHFKCYEKTINSFSSKE